MADGNFSGVDRFDDQERLKHIRENILNPLTLYTKNVLDPKVTQVDKDVKTSFKGVSYDSTSNSLRFTKVDGTIATVQLPAGAVAGIDITNDKGNLVRSVTKLTMDDVDIQAIAPDGAHLSFDWTTLVPNHQDHLYINKKGSGVQAPRTLQFDGSSVDVSYDATSGTSTVTITDPPSQIMASIPGATPPVNPTAISGIELSGDVENSKVENGKLTIHVNPAGSGTFSGNFKGFFANEGELISEVPDPVSGKSFAFVKDSLHGGLYYTPYFYVNGTWNELKTDPALLYEPVGGTGSQGVFSIKPDARITLDATGQLDLSGLAVPQEPALFKGFFDNIAALNAAVPNPRLEADWAYVKSSAANSGWVAYKNVQQGTASRQWKIFAPMGSFAAVDRKDSPNNYQQVFGIYKNDTWDIDSRGILELKPFSADVNVAIAGESSVGVGKIDTLQFMAGKSYASIQGKKLFINHPQRVIEYDANWEADHNTQDYRGNIFYDDNSKTWKGWSTPKAGSGVGLKWTSIAHEGMSDEVINLTTRNPPSIPDVTPGGTGENRDWEFTGHTYLMPEDENLPDDVRSDTTLGAYIKTYVAGGNVTSSSRDVRMQECIIDDDSGRKYIRRYDKDITGTGSKWKPWRQISFTPDIITKHENDPHAHRSIIKFHRVLTFTARYADFVSQIEGDAPGGLRGANCHLVADNYGGSTGSTDYIEFPYSGNLKISGQFTFSGYKENVKEFEPCQWRITIRRSGTAGQWNPVGFFTYDHTDKTRQYPLMSFDLGTVMVKAGDKLVVNIVCNKSVQLASQHPDLYFTPMKTYLVVEDVDSRAGSRIAETFSRFLSNVEAIGSTGVKVHYSDIKDETGNIRLYGTRVRKDTKEMKRVN